MEQYINKAKVVAEIKKRLSLLEGGTGHPEVVKRVEGVINGYKSILSFIDTLEVKEVDLKEEIEDYVEQHKSELSGYFDIRRIARHFFGLGLETQIAQNVHVIKNKIMTTEKTQAEIDDLFDRCVESENRNESAYRGMTYEQGIKATLDWLFNGAEHPLDE